MQFPASATASELAASPILVGLGDGEFKSLLARELETAWQLFRAELHSDLACVNNLVEHVESYRGKMLRPTLVYVSSLATDAVAVGGDLDNREPTISQTHRVLATVVEMVHMATLVHDDILDEADTRRRGVTINRLKGNEAAVMLGDYLISHAYHLCSSLDDQGYSREVADTTNTVCEGELLQLANRNNWELDEATYFEIIRRKTAILCQLCCRLGARAAIHAAASTRPPSQTRSSDQAHLVDALARYGEQIGIAFQIIDDVLDLTGSEATVGKTLRSDITKGKLTLPIIHHLNSRTAADRRRIVARLELITSPDSLLSSHALSSISDRPDPSQHDDDLSPELVSLAADIADSDSLRYASSQAAACVDRATDALKDLPLTPAVALLREMAQAVLRRNK